jgi:hypothetical protein
MSNNVYFANSVNDQVSVNINDGLSNHALNPRTTTSANNVVTVVNCSAVQVPTGPNRDKDVFGTGGGQANTVRVEFGELESGSQTYTVKPENMSGRDLYIYVFDGTIVGQDETGRPFSIGGPDGGSVVSAS